MSTPDTEQLIHEIVEGRAKTWLEAQAQFREQRCRQELLARANQERQLRYMRAAGINLKELEEDDEKADKDLKRHLEKVRPVFVDRPDSRASDGRSRAVLFNHFSPGNIVVPTYGIFSPPPPDSPPVVSSGWVFTTGQVRMKASDTGSGTGWWATAQPPPQPHDVIFTFIPAANGAYDLTAILSFHGFYILRADDGWLTNKNAEVTLGVQMNVHQYSADLGWKTFPSPLNQSGSNIDELNNYDRTVFFDNTANLRGGDPVVVTVRLTVIAVASGSGSYAEINFADGTANYVEPLFLSVGPA
jgi:hypothetical protein